MFKKENLKLPMNIQFFAEPGEPSGGDGKQQDPHGNQQQQNQQQTVPEIDYDKLSQLIAGKQSVTEDSVLKGYFKQQGLSKEEMKQAIESFKQQKAANEPDINAIQHQANAAQIQAQQAMIERDAMMLSNELGIDLKTMPYVLKMADMSQVIGDDKKIDQEKLKEALNKVLEDVPQLKPQPDNSQTGFRQIGVGQQSQQLQTTQTQKPSVPTKRWNRFN